MKCKYCGKAIVAQRATKIYCDGKCRALAWQKNHAKDEPKQEQGGISVKEIVYILNWYLENDRDSMEKWSMIDAVNALVQRIGGIAYDGERFISA